jgi:type IV pilus assembly protein PilB
MQTAPVAPSSSLSRDTQPEAGLREEERAPSSDDLEPVSDAPYSEDSPGSSPEIEATEITPKRKLGPRMVALTLLDGTTIALPATKKRASRPDAEPPSEISDTFTARDLISALRAVSHGADATEILGEKPPTWEALVSTLLSLLLKKGLIADWEFVEEFRKI